MKNFIIIFFISSSFLFSQISDQEHKEILKKSPFNKMYPKVIAGDAAEYFN